MDLEQDIRSLTKACEAWLRDDGYSEARISDYRRLWKNGALRYMEEHSITNYSTDVGERFIGTLGAVWSAPYRRAIRRSVLVL